MILRTTLILFTLTLVVSFWLVWGFFGPSVSSKFLELGAEYFPGVPEVTPGEGGSDTFARAGQWGDGFGPLNALFAGIASVCVFATLSFQVQATSRQVTDYHRQRFESTYFELLKLLRETRTEVRFENSTSYRQYLRKVSSNALLRAESSPTAEPKPASGARSVVRTKKAALDGREAFKPAVMEMIYHLKDLALDDAVDSEFVGKLYRKVIHGRHESTWSPYFRIIYTMLRRIRDDKVLSDAEKVQFANLLRSQLTSFEVSLAAFNALMSEANDFKDLLTDFHMLKYVPEGARKRTLAKLYDPKAFEPRFD